MTDNTETSRDFDERRPHQDLESVTDEHHAFWADTIADRIEDRNPAEPIVIKGGISPSGVPHLGNVNEIMRGYFVAEVLRDRGYRVRQVFTSDDRDPLRKLPRILCDLEGNLVDLGDVDAAALGENLGQPYTDVPDPFHCCGSYGEHFGKLIQTSADALGVSIELRSTTELYEDGTLEPAIVDILKQRDTAIAVLSEFQEKVDDSYVPFNPICLRCGKITEDVTNIDLESRTVEYRCTGIEAGGREIEGCGHEGTVGLDEGKLPWRFEWPAQWRELGVDFEPFGKDHAEGSWPSGVDIVSTLLNAQPPVPMTYEWFTLNGEPFSSSEGNVILVSDVLELLEPEVLRYFFTKAPGKARDFDIDRLDLLVDEFDRFEAIYFDEVSADDRERKLADRVYPFVVDTVDPNRIRLPYTFAAVLGMSDDPSIRFDIATAEGHIPADADEQAVTAAMERVDRARQWAKRTKNEFDYELKRTDIPDHDFDEATEAALDDLATFVESGQDGQAIQGEIYETAKRHDVDVGEFFAAGYRLFFDDTQGPKLGPFLGKLDREFVIDRLRRKR